MLVGKKSKLTFLTLALLSGVVVCAALFFVVPHGVYAQGELAQGDTGKLLEDTGAAIPGLAKGDPRDLIIRVVKILLSLLGIIALIVMLYGGYQWMTSANEPQKVADAKKTVVNGVIGLAIILASYGITVFIFNALIKAINDGGSDGGAGNPPLGGGIGALGSGIIQSHWPPRNAADIPRNTKIIITFKEPMDLGTIREQSEEASALKTDAVRILTKDTFADGAVAPLTAQVSATADGRTISIDPDIDLGNPIDEVWYRVGLSEKIKKANGNPAFDSLGTYLLDVGSPTPIGFKFGYHWDFQTSTLLDTTPPRVKKVFPANLEAGVPRNAVVQITFTEEVDPTSVSGTVPPFANITLAEGAENVTGAYHISSNYRTATFISNTPCGTNSCGEEVFCLPANAALDGTVHAATLQFAQPDPMAKFPYDGVVDMVGNSLDGNSNGTAEGADDVFGWSFDTGNSLDLTAPRMEITGAENTPYLEPDSLLESSNIDPDAPIQINFNELLNAATLKPDSGYDSPHEYITLLYPLNNPIAYSIGNITGDGCTARCLFRGNPDKGPAPEQCGDGMVDEQKGEACDDGNAKNGDGCSAECLYEPSAVCGDGVVGRGEDCDDGQSPPQNNDGCSATCTWEGNASSGGDILQQVCGNGTINYGESCDDSNNEADDGCTATCTREHPSPPAVYADGGTCGDGIVQRLNNGVGEDCDDRNNTDGDGCSSVCAHEGSLCGDKNLDRSLAGNGGGEECDDGNNAAGDGCSAACLLEGNPAIGNGAGQCGNAAAEAARGEACDDGNPIDKTTVFINHSSFADTTEYAARAGSGVQDAYQNCFTPSRDDTVSGCNAAAGVIAGPNCVAN